MEPRDVFPRMNLPGEATPWGRTLENYSKKTRRDLETEKRFQAGANRNTAATLEGIGEQLTELNETQAELATAQERLNEVSKYVADTQTLNLSDVVETGLQISLDKPEWAYAAMVMAGATKVEDNGDTYSQRLELAVTDYDQTPGGWPGDYLTAISGGIASPDEFFIVSYPRILPVEETLYMCPYTFPTGATDSGAAIQIEFQISIQWLTPYD